MSHLFLGDNRIWIDVYFGKKVYDISMWLLVVMMLMGSVTRGFYMTWERCDMREKLISALPH